MIILHNGAFLQDSEFKISPADRGLTLGDGVFDTMLAQDGAPLWAREHFARLTYNASVLGISFDLDFDNMAQELLRQNGFTSGRHAIRTTVTRGAGARGLAPPESSKPTVLMAAAPAPRKTTRIEAIIAQDVRRNEHSPLSKIKSLNYGDNLLALIEAQKKGAEDALLLNTAGHVCCATTSNIFIREGEKLITPPLSDGVLAGITRTKIISAHNAAEESLTPERLFEADAIFLSNSIQGVRAVKRLDHTYFNKNAPAIPDPLAA